MSEKFSSWTKNPKQTNKQNLLVNWVFTAVCISMFLNPIEFKSLYFAHVFFCILEINVINNTVFLHGWKAKADSSRYFIQNGCTLIGIWERVIDFPLISDFCQTKLTNFFQFMNRFNRRSDRAFSSTEGDSGSIPGRNIPKSFNNS